MNETIMKMRQEWGKGDEKRDAGLEIPEGLDRYLNIPYGPLPENLLERVYDRCIRIPMIEGARSLNLSNSVAICAYEVLRQHNFEHLLDHGSLTLTLPPTVPAEPVRSPS